MVLISKDIARTQYALQTKTRLSSGAILLTLRHLVARGVLTPSAKKGPRGRQEFELVPGAMTAFAHRLRESARTHIEDADGILRVCKAAELFDTARLSLELAHEAAHWRSQQLRDAVGVTIETLATRERQELRPYVFLSRFSRIMAEERMFRSLVDVLDKELFPSTTGAERQSN